MRLQKVVMYKGGCVTIVKHELFKWMGIKSTATSTSTSLFNDLTFYLWVNYSIEWSYMFFFSRRVNLDGFDWLFYRIKMFTLNATYTHTHISININTQQSNSPTITAKLKNFWHFLHFSFPFRCFDIVSHCECVTWKMCNLLYDLS